TGPRHADAERCRADVGPARCDRRSGAKTGLLGGAARDLAHEFMAAIEARQLLDRNADRLGRLLVPRFLLILVGVAEAGIAGIHREGARHAEGAIAGRRQELVGCREDMRLVLGDPQRLRVDEPRRDAVAVDAVDLVFADAAANVLALGLGT